MSVHVAVMDAHTIYSDAIKVDAGRGFSFDGRWLMSNRHARHGRWLAGWLQDIATFGWNTVMLTGCASWALWLDMFPGRRAFAMMYAVAIPAVVVTLVVMLPVLRP